jgi:BirA family biotin operon repressor/biotin-[acetyl-CoA-carboxylase] ligase
MKGQILKILRAENDVVSGETLSSHLGISRVSIWKHIKKLREFGYNVQATPKGYRLINDPDILYPWEFGDRELKIHYFDEVTSTMDVARNLARNDSPQRRALFYHYTQAANTPGVKLTDQLCSIHDYGPNPAQHV